MSTPESSTTKPKGASGAGIRPSRAAALGESSGQAKSTGGAGKPVKVKKSAPSKTEKAIKPKPVEKKAPAQPPGDNIDRLALTMVGRLKMPQLFSPSHPLTEPWLHAKNEVHQYALHTRRVSVEQLRSTATLLASQGQVEKYLETHVGGPHPHPEGAAAFRELCIEHMGDKCPSVEVTASLMRSAAAVGFINSIKYLWERPDGVALPSEGFAKTIEQFEAALTAWRLAHAQSAVTVAWRRCHELRVQLDASLDRARESVVKPWLTDLRRYYPELAQKYDFRTFGKEILQDDSVLALAHQVEQEEAECQQDQELVALRAALGADT